MLNNHMNNIAKQLSDNLAENLITSKLENIVNLIDDAASKTIDLVESSLPITEFLTKECNNFSQQLSKNKSKIAEVQVNQFISSVINSLLTISNNLEEILLSQKNQYALAMVVNKFIDDLKGLDLKLVALLQDKHDEKTECEINTN
jgi:chemotaxis regulatin CheY-phosphate phosphatase CheZ